MPKNKKQKRNRSLMIVKTYFPKVTRCVDASEPLHIQVTDADNKSSQVRNHNACAMAVACKRTFKCDGVIIAVGTAYIVKNNVATRYFLPQSVSREVVSFDREAGFAAGEYQLSHIPPSKKIGERRTSYDGSQAKWNSGTLKNKTMFKHHTEGVRAALGSKRAPDGIVRSQ